jgi:hypothetical protein
LLVSHSTFYILFPSFLIGTTDNLREHAAHVEQHPYYCHYSIPFIFSNLTLATLEYNDAGDDADDEEEFADEYTVTPAMLEGLW